MGKPKKSTQTRRFLTLEEKGTVLELIEEKVCFSFFVIFCEFCSDWSIYFVADVLFSFVFCSMLSV